MAVTGSVGARLYTSATPLADTIGSADAVGDFTGLTIATEIGMIESVGEFGRQFDVATFIELYTGRTHKFKSSYNDGTLTLVVGQDLSDAGQAALRSYAMATDQNTYPFKLTLLGAPSSYDTVWFGALVRSFRSQLGGAGQVIRATVELDINTTIFFN
ncbi:MAG: hypothetical protein AB7F35_06380 [Acetobacteraceae bacterium]